MASEAAPAIPFFKKKTRPASARKRETSLPSEPSLLTASSSASGSGSGSGSAVKLPVRKTVANPLIQGTKRKLASRDDATTAYDEDTSAVDDLVGPDVKWRASGNTQDAIDAERLAISRDEESSALSKKARLESDLERGEDGLYHGAGAYTQHITKDKEIPKSMRRGPQKGQNTIRTVTIMDYQPDVCKDYKETGYCGFGDTCKFLHDRGTYLQGWQLDKLAADPKAQAGDDSDSSDEEDIPWACFICRKPYTDPVVTRCGHYFCSACAIKRFAKTPKCVACGAPTGGIFNRADKVIQKMRNKKEEKEKKEAAGSDDDGPVTNDLELEILDQE